MGPRIEPTNRIVLAFSGASTGALRRLVAEGVAEVITATLDLGQGRLLEGVRDRALDEGAIRAHVLDAREEFARDYFVPALKADASAEGDASFLTALARPLVARKLVELARIEEAAAVAYRGCGSPAGFPELEGPLAALAPGLRILVADAGADRDEPPALARPAAECPPHPALVNLSFERGVPTAINGVPMPILDLIESLGTIAAAHGVGRLKPRDIRDAPAARLLQTAHRELRSSTAADKTRAAFDARSAEYADTIRAGRWFGPERDALDRWMASANDRVTGDVRLKLVKGTIATEGVTPRKPTRLPIVRAND